MSEPAQYVTVDTAHELDEALGVTFTAANGKIVTRKDELKLVLKR
jgi:hypothetical protein